MEDFLNIYERRGFYSPPKHLLLLLEGFGSGKICGSLSKYLLKLAVISGLGRLRFFKFWRFFAWF